MWLPGSCLRRNSHHSAAHQSRTRPWSCPGSSTFASCSSAQPRTSEIKQVHDMRLKQERVSLSMPQNPMSIPSSCAPFTTACHCTCAGAQVRVAMLAFEERAFSTCKGGATEQTHHWVRALRAITKVQSTPIHYNGAENNDLIVSIISHTCWLGAKYLH